MWPEIKSRRCLRLKLLRSCHVAWEWFQTHSLPREWQMFSIIRLGMLSFPAQEHYVTPYLTPDVNCWPQFLNFKNTYKPMKHFENLCHGSPQCQLLIQSARANSLGYPNQHCPLTSRNLMWQQWISSGMVNQFLQRIGTAQSLTGFYFLQRYVFILKQLNCNDFVTHYIVNVSHLASPPFFT